LRSNFTLSTTFSPALMTSFVARTTSGSGSGSSASVSGSFAFSAVLLRF